MATGIVPVNTKKKITLKKSKVRVRVEHVFCFMKQNERLSFKVSRYVRATEKQMIKEFLWFD